MKQALIIGNSGGIGAALHAQCEGQGWHCTGLSRSKNGLDVTDDDSVASAMAGLEGPFDLVFLATGILAVDGHEPEKALSEIEGTAMARVLAVNTIGPALLLRHLPRMLPKHRPSHIGVLSARVGSIGDNKIGGWHSYRASKAAVNQIVHGAAIELSRTHNQAVCVALHPGTVETAFSKRYAGRYKTTPALEAAENLMRVLMGLTPEDSGGFYDWRGDVVPW